MTIALTCRGFFTRPKCRYSMCICEKSFVHMRKILVVVVLFLIEWLAAILLESVTSLWLFDPPWIYFLIGSVCVQLIIIGILSLSEIRSLIDSEERRIRRGRAKLERADKEARRSKEEFYGRPYFGTVKREGNTITTAIVFPRTWRHRLASRLTWMVNHRMLPKRLYIKLGEALGYTYKGHNPA